MKSLLAEVSWMQGCDFYLCDMQFQDNKISSHLLSSLNSYRFNKNTLKVNFLSFQ